MLSSFTNKFNADLGVGVGLRSPHYPDVLHGGHGIPWFEAIAENFMGIGENPRRNSGFGFRDGGPPLRKLEKIRENSPVVLHGVSLSIGSTDELDLAYLKRLRLLHEQIEPAWISDHLCWTGVEGENLHDLLPLPYTEEAVAHVVERVKKVQDILGRQILLENVSSYVTYAHSTMDEWEFLTAISERADCGLLLDLNNIYVSAINHGFSAEAFLRGVPPNRVGQLHLAGHSKSGGILVDTHDGPVCDEVWDLYRTSLSVLGEISTLIEWDGKLPSFEVLKTEALKAEALNAEILKSGGNRSERARA